MMLGPFFKILMPSVQNCVKKFDNKGVNFKPKLIYLEKKPFDIKKLLIIEEGGEIHKTWHFVCGSS
jgi:hypothetical protein